MATKKKAAKKIAKKKAAVKKIKKPEQKLVPLINRFLNTHMTGFTINELHIGPAAAIHCVPPQVPGMVEQPDGTLKLGCVNP